MKKYKNNGGGNIFIVVWQSARFYLLECDREEYKKY